MEILILLVIIFIILNKKSPVASKLKTESLPTRLNPKGYYDRDAFTDLYHTLKQQK